MVISFLNRSRWTHSPLPSDCTYKHFLGAGADSYPHLYLSEADGFARISFRTMTAASKHWVIAGLTDQSDAVSKWHLFQLGFRGNP